MLCIIADAKGRGTRLSPLQASPLRAPHPICNARSRSLTGHLNRGIDGIRKIVRVVGRGLVSIAEVHAIGARTHLA